MSEDQVMAWVYIVQCSDGSYYVGSTIDLEARVEQHNRGDGATYTRRRRPVVLRWSAYYDRVDEAYAMEKRIQGWGRRKREALIDGRVELLPDLSSRSWASRRRRED